MSETDKEFVDNIAHNYRDLLWRTFGPAIADRLLSLALRGAEAQWRPIEESPKNRGGLLVRGGTFSWDDCSGRNTVPHSGVTIVYWRGDGWEGGGRDEPTIHQPEEFIPLSALGEPKEKKS